MTTMMDQTGCAPVNTDADAGRRAYLVRQIQQIVRYLIAFDGGKRCVDLRSDLAAQVDELARAHPLWIESDSGLDVRALEQRSGQAVIAWGANPAHERETFFDANTALQVRKVLEGARRDDREIRIMLGDVQTGEQWLEEYDVFGRVGRSCGVLRVPLLMSSGRNYGGAILTECIVRIIDPRTRKDLYRLANYQQPKLRVVADVLKADPTYQWAVVRERASGASEVQARFADAGEAHLYVAFQLGSVPEPIHIDDDRDEYDGD